MKISPLPDLQLETIFKDIRSAILLSISKIKNNSEILTFQVALSSHCFTNEYLYDKTDLEIKSLSDKVKGLMFFGGLDIIFINLD